MDKKILVTGGAGFIGSNFVLEWLSKREGCLLNFDKLTYAGNLENLASLQHESRHIFIKGDILDVGGIANVLTKHRPCSIIHFAAESHVDRAIAGPADFIATNINGTFSLLEAARAYWQDLTGEEKGNFRFLHVSTDEVYGSLKPDECPFTETTPYAPNNPYAASKAASDHLVRAYHHTYGLPTLTINCSNNFGPYQFPEKLIPRMIHHALSGNILPIYGDGLQVRDWIYVTDHCSAIRRVLDAGRIGEVYNIGARCEMTNLDVVCAVCDLLDKLSPKHASSYRDQIAFIDDRRGHDRRYAIDPNKIEQELGWKPVENFETGINKTVQWYLNHPDWVANIINGTYHSSLERFIHI